MENFIALLPLILTFLVFPLAAFMALRVLPQPIRIAAFAVVCLGGAFGLTVIAASHGVRMRDARTFIPIAVCFYCLYVAVVAIQYLNVRRAAAHKNPSATFAVLFPILVLIYVKYTPDSWNVFSFLSGSKHLPEFFVGISYMAFRLSYMVQEVRNAVVPAPRLTEYLSFAFFPPTLSIGPINPYSKFFKSLHHPDSTVTPLGWSVLRVIVGATKYFFLSNLFNQLTYAGLLFDGNPHPPVDLVIALFAYTFYMYTNFSGYCDMVIGISGLLGIHVVENFADPFLARNLQMFWNRWHISLSTYMRDMMFSPLSKALIRRFGPNSAVHVIAISIFAVFVVVGIWHGAGLNYVLFGVWQGLGLATCHYYTHYLKKRLGKKRYAAYMSNRSIEVTSTAFTFVYFSLGLFLFANTVDQMGRIFQIVH